MEFSYQIFQGCKLTRRETRFLLSENPVPGIPVPYDPEPKLRIDNPKATTSDAIKVRDKCTIRNAGKGLFARKCIPKGSHITTYDGDLYLLSKADRESWLNTPVLRSHAKMLKGKSANACYVINGLKEYMPNRGLASLANDPANNFAFANSRLVYDDKKDILYLEALRTIEAGEEIFYRYDNHFPLVTDTAPSQRCQQPVRLNRSLISKEICSTNIKASIKTLTSSLNKKCIKTPEFRELRRHRHKHYHTEHKTPTKLRFERKWDKALTTYALIREKFIATSKITKSALNQLRKRSTIYKKLLEVYLQNLDKTTSDVNRALSNKKGAFTGWRMKSEGLQQK
ncbi:MAG: hypothetical protein B0D91_06755 [Oceanospirillales bacterium LUC14_002_19_P2]|nr:MAG: hypothetical protein B0D91_06755 [Oceanospirillales bacterium LUC14_002_19_P2]